MGMRKNRPGFPGIGEAPEMVPNEEGIFLLEDDRIIPFLKELGTSDGSMILIVTAGSIEIEVDLCRYSIAAASLLSVIPGQIVCYGKVSDDFRALAIINSSQFSGFLEINIQEAIPLFLELKKIPHVSLTKENLKMLEDLYGMLKYVVKTAGGSYHNGVIRHLFQVLFYLVLDIYSKPHDAKETKKTSQDFIFESFYNSVYTHYKQERKLKFYSDKLCLTPKYLSAVIKKMSGKSPNDWINSFVVLEAKTLLKSSKMTIQQICDELNFPSQSFFGKYFKRHTGMSPKEYRQN